MGIWRARHTSARPLLAFIAVVAALWFTQLSMPYTAQADPASGNGGNSASDNGKKDSSPGTKGPSSQSTKRGNPAAGSASPTGNGSGGDTRSGSTPDGTDRGSKGRSTADGQTNGGKATGDGSSATSKGAAAGSTVKDRNSASSNTSQQPSDSSTTSASGSPSKQTTAATTGTNSSATGTTSKGDADNTPTGASGTTRTGTDGEVVAPSNPTTNPPRDGSAAGTTRGTDTVAANRNSSDDHAQTRSLTAAVTQDPANVAGVRTAVRDPLATAIAPIKAAFTHAVEKLLSSGAPQIDTTMWKHATLEATTATAAAPAAIATAQNAVMTAASTAVTLPTSAKLVIDQIGTAIFSVVNVALTALVGPAQLPAGSNVTVSRSTLQLPCSSSACTVDADWYFPKTSTPQGLIYFQHGIFANSAMYSYTAAALAEATNSIVVAPSITSNFFAPDALWLGGSPMQQAIADLFVGDRSALNASAAQAAGHPVTLPEDVVLVGHSLGGSAVLAAAGDMAGNGSVGDLKGVVILDGVPADPNLVSTAISALPANLPIRSIASPAYWLNRLGEMSTELEAARPGQFNGIQLVGGSHIDAIQGGNPIIQFAEGLIGGFPKPENVAAYRDISAGWVNDMFAGTDNGLTAAPGQTITIPTTAGAATAIALPAPPTPLTPVDLILDATLKFVFGTFGNIEPLTTSAALAGATSAAVPFAQAQPTTSAAVLAGANAVGVPSTGPTSPQDFITRSLVSAIGSPILNALLGNGGIVQAISGAPVLPPGSTVTVHTSTLTLPDIGDTVPAYWYVPAHVDANTHLIYLQHGFGATAPMYSYVAANLAESTNSIVVTPSLSSDVLDPHGHWLNGIPMGRSVADLFVGDRAALTASASAALGYPVTLPTRMLLVGHSGGGALVGAVAGDMVDNGTSGDLAGVILLDAVDPYGSNQLADGVSKLPKTVPVLLMSSQPYFWNRNGNAAAVLQAARPDTFNGVVLVNGLHGDYSQGGNAFLQLAQYAVLGVSLPQNIDAASTIETGWINDIFDGTHTGIYGSPGQAIPISTASGTATAVVLPIAPTPISYDNAISSAIFDYLASNFFVFQPLVPAVSPAVTV